MWISNKGYRLMSIKEGGKRKLVLEHRQIMEGAMGRKLRHEEAVHHLNGDRLDNRIENLAIMEHGSHSKLHYKSFLPAVPWNKGMKTLIETRCFICGLKFTRSAKEIRHTMNRGMRIVCSRVCRSKAAHIPK